MTQHLSKHVLRYGWEGAAENSRNCFQREKLLVFDVRRGEFPKHLTPNLRPKTVLRMEINNITLRDFFSPSCVQTIRKAHETDENEISLRNTRNRYQYCGVFAQSKKC
jgi:hypothetical protein